MLSVVRLLWVIARSFNPFWAPGFHGNTQYWRSLHKEKYVPLTLCSLPPTPALLRHLNPHQNHCTMHSRYIQSYKHTNWPPVFVLQYDVTQIIRKASIGNRAVYEILQMRFVLLLSVLVWVAWWVWGEASSHGKEEVQDIVGAHCSIDQNIYTYTDCVVYDACQH